MRKVFKSALCAAAMLAGMVGCDLLKEVEEQGKADLEVTVTEVTSSSVTFNVKATDKDYSYACAVVEKAVAESATDEISIYNAVIDYLQKEAVTSSSFEAFLKSQIRQGGSIITVGNLAPDTEYCILVAGIATTGEQTVGGLKVDFKTEEEVINNTDPFSFDIKIENVTDYDVTYSVYPTDRKSSYMVMLVEKDYFDSFAGDEEYFQDDLEYFQEVADAYEVSLNELLSESLMQGNIEHDVMDDLDPETEYYIYCYGLTASGVRTTSIYKAAFTTAALQMSDVKFNASASVDGATVNVTISPSDNSVLYYTDAWKTGEFETSDYAAEAKDYVESIADLYKMFGYSVEDFCQSGPVRGALYLDPNEDYVMFTVAVSASGKCISDVDLVTFRTGDVKPSDNQIRISVVPGSTSANIAVSTTNSDPYVLGVFSASEFAGMTEEQVVSAVIEASTGDYGIETYNGAESVTQSGLDPESRYVVVAFGCHAGIKTTQVFTQAFTTTEKTASNGTLIITPGYYDGDQVYAAMGADYADCQGYAFFFVDAKTEGISSYYWDIFDYSESLMQASDSEFQAYLYSEGNTDDESAYLIDWNSTLVLAYFGIDEAGNPTDVTREIVTVTKENAISLYSASKASAKKVGSKTPCSKLGQKKAVEKKIARTSKTFKPVAKSPRHRNF